jgi:hypothetical protein
MSIILLNQTNGGSNSFEKSDERLECRSENKNHFKAGSGRIKTFSPFICHWSDPERNNRTMGTRQAYAEE